MPATNVAARWASGSLEFYDPGTGTTVLKLDGPNLLATLAKVAFPTATATATSGGLTTGTVADAGMLQFVTVTSGNADHIVVLPTPTPGTIVVLRNGGTGYELRSSAPATVAINGGTGASAESAIAANTLVVAVCGTATSWSAWGVAGATLAAVEAAA